MLRIVLANSNQVPGWSGHRVQLTWVQNMIKALLGILLAACVTQVEAAQISGQANAIDSAIIQMGDQRVMLFGVDWVMRKQSCLLNGKPWLCWDAAVRDLQAVVDQGTVTCDAVGDPNPYGRVLGRCSVNGYSVNEEYVDRGFGLARPSETTDYVAAEAAAKEKKLGLWQGEFKPPSEFRRFAHILVERP
jgi:endonuclease YncB( thermonuclease family)